MKVTSCRTAGCASFAAWLPVTLTGLVLTFSILVFVGLPTVLIGSSLLVTSVRATSGSRPALWAIVIGALPILGWLVVPMLFVAHSTPNGTLGWSFWASELALAVCTIAAGAAALAR